MVQISSENLVDNKFLLGTTVLSFASWVIAFGGLCGASQYNLGVGWWIIVFELLLLLGITYLHLTDLFHQYRLVVLAFLAVSISYITGQLSSAIQLTYSWERSAGGAIAAGYIILIIIQIAWIFAFGSEPQSYIGELVKSNHNNSVQQQPPQQHHQEQQQQQQQFQQPIELTSEKIAYETNSPTTTNNINQASPALSHPSAVNSPVLEYKERVEALHDYTASPDDPNELSFGRGEVLEIVDRRGNWWQARKSDGTVGIIPSNYFA